MNDSWDLFRPLIAVQVAVLDYYNTDCSNHDEAKEHLNELEQCVKEITKKIKQIRKEEDL